MRKLHYYVSFLLLFCAFSFKSYAFLTKGIYLTQGSLETTSFLTYLLSAAKTAHIDTFIVDLERPSNKYAENIKLLKQNHIQYVARIIMFPGGATPADINSSLILAKKKYLMDTAISYGADQIQLDYIRYNTKQPASSQNAEKVFAIIKNIKATLSDKNTPLQIDVFGIASFGEEKHIGQNIKLFAEVVETICPMVYPSHYEPFREHAVKPYETVYSSLKAIHAQFKDKMPVKLIPYIELSNYRYKLSHTAKMAYIAAQIKAAEDAGADGFYVWSPHNRYENLFALLESGPVK